MIGKNYPRIPHGVRGLADSERYLSCDSIKNLNTRDYDALIT